MQRSKAGFWQRLKIRVKIRFSRCDVAMILLAAGFLPVMGAEVLTAAGQSQDTDARFPVCHGYGCYFRTLVILTPSDLKAISKVFSAMGKTPQGERQAIRKAVAIFEERSTQVIGVRDEPRMAFARPKRKGQMDCIDESTNTENLLRYLKKAGYLKFHEPVRRTARGIFIDGRYPHWTAVVVDDQNMKWAVDSWYEPGGGEPDIIPLKEWKKHGVGGKR